MKIWFATLLAVANAATFDLDARTSSCVNYTNPLTQKSGCCNPATSSIWWTNLPLGQGVCCPFGTILDGFLCASPPPPPKSNVCSGVAACPQTAGQDLGIKYGGCYVLQSIVEGNYLGHDYDVKYEVLGENPGVVFRVCAGQGDCVTNAGNVVGVNSTWYMQDQFGDPDGTGFGWLGGSGDLSVQDSPTDALLVGGSSICYGGQCSVCIRFPPGGAHAPCPLSPGQSHLGVASNPNNCQPFFWQPVNCRSEM